jgi:DsbC/DsbD-like thiol-disulfide interchange protein
MLVALEEYLDARPDAAIAAGPAPADDLPGGQEIVSAQAEIAQDARPAPGAELDIALTLSVKPGWHVYANPPGVETLKPTTVALAADQPAALVRIEYPAGASKVLASSGDEKVNLYEGKTTLTARVRLARDLKPGASSLTFQVRYQACNDRACLAPASLAVTVPLAVTP